MKKPTPPVKDINIRGSVSLFNPREVLLFLTKHKDNLDYIIFDYDAYSSYNSVEVERMEFILNISKPNDKYEEELKQYNIDLEAYKASKASLLTEAKIATKQSKINLNLGTNAKELIEVNKQIDSLLSSKKLNPVKLAQLNLNKAKLEVKKEKLESDLVMLDKTLLSIKSPNEK